MSLYNIEEVLDVDTKTATLSTVLDSMRKKGIETYAVTVEDAQGAPSGCMIFCIDPQLTRKLAAVLEGDEQVGISAVHE